MCSAKWSATPPPPPSGRDAPMLEAKVDELHRKLDQLGPRGPMGGCPMCGLCSQHNSQLSAQTKRLESLERKVMEVRTALEKLTCGLQERNFDNVSVPAVALQRRKSLPVRTSVDEVYVRLDMPRDQKTIANAFNVPCGKGRADVLIEDNECERLRGGSSSVRNNAAEVQHDPQSHKEVKTEAANQSSPEPDNVVKKRDRIALTTQKHSQTAGTALPTSKVVAPAPRTVPKITVTKTSQNQMAPKATETTVKPSGPLSSVTAAKTQITLTSSQKTTDRTPPANAKASDNSVSNNTTKLALTGSTVAPPSVQNLQKFHNLTVITPAAPQVLGKPLPNTLSSQTLFGANTKFLHSDNLTIKNSTSGPAKSPTCITLPKTSSASSEKEITSTSPKSPHLANVDVPTPTMPQTSSTNSLFTTKIPTTAAKGSSLKHVHSCPDSLQRLHEAGVKAVNPVAPPAIATAGTGQLVAGGGVQIRITPAPEIHATQTKAAPKTCLKIIDDVPPQPAPFPHRFVSLRPSPPCDYSIYTREVLGGGRFGKVHKCTDNKTNLRLAAKIISARNAKEREMALNEIQVMNQLSHPNILQLYDAYEAKNQVVLILEYVEGGELFERIVDERSPLTELDAMIFVKQICEGIQYMHQMYVLHLDLKPENILCVNRSGYQIKIIDFGLARRYKPREKLRVSFGTPEFLAPEVVNFDFVSFPTDMWTLGVVTYMLLSGLSPFLGDDDSQTLNNVITVNWSARYCLQRLLPGTAHICCSFMEGYFDEDTFEHVSAEAKDFVSNLLIKERSGRLSATQCLKHPWLNNITEKAKHSNVVLKSQVLLRKYMARRLWKKNYIAIAAANRFKKISSSGSLTSMGI